MGPAFEYETYHFPAAVMTGNPEQGVEWDGVLPDYLPDLSRVLRCTLVPLVLERRVVAEVLHLEGEILIRMVYESSEDPGLSVFETSIPFQKTMDVSSCSDEAIARIRPRVDYCHCRVVNKRRAEIRGAVSFRCEISCGEEETLPVAVTGDGMEYHKKEAECVTLQATAALQSIERGDFPLEERMTAVIDQQIGMRIVEKRSVDGKLFVKGSFLLHLLLQQETGGLKSLLREMPFSRVLEDPAITEGGVCQVFCEILSFEATLPEQETGEELLSCHVEFHLSARQLQKNKIAAIDDLFSVAHPVFLQKKQLLLPCLSEMIEETGSVTEQIKWGDEKPKQVVDLFGTLDRVNLQVRFGEVHLQGNLIYTFYLEREDDSTFVQERSVPFEMMRKLQTENDDLRFEGSLELLEVDLGEMTDQGATVSASMLLSGSVTELHPTEFVCDATVETDRKKEGRQPGDLVLYFGEKGESVWSIAKKYDLSVKSLMEENHLTEEVLGAKSLLLIPTKAY